jgi:hypothetical protein
MTLIKTSEAHVAETMMFYGLHTNVQVELLTELTNKRHNTSYNKEEVSEILIKLHSIEMRFYAESNGEIEEDDVDIWNRLN